MHTHAHTHMDAGMHNACAHTLTNIIIIVVVVKKVNKSLLVVELFPAPICLPGLLLPVSVIKISLVHLFLLPSVS